MTTEIHGWSFSFTKLEWKAFEKFRERHNKCASKNAEGKRYAQLQLILEPNAIGIVVQVQCKCCGKTKDITDYKSW